MSQVAPLFNDLAEGPDGGAAAWLTTKDDVTIRVGHWQREGSKGTVLIFPGRTEYIEKYGKDAGLLLDQGFDVIAIDWRGQGLSERQLPNRLLGHVEKFTDYQHDVNAVIAYARAQSCPEPFFLLAHSMGGCIGLRALHNRLPVKATVFSAPMWGIKFAPMVKPFAWGITSLAGSIGLARALAPGQVEETYVARNPFTGNTLTTDEPMFDYMRRQVQMMPDLALGGPTMQWLHEAMVEMNALCDMTPPPIPTVTLLGTDEAIIDPASVKSVMQHWTNGTLNIYDKAQHEILMERPAIREAAFKTLTAHFHAHLTNSNVPEPA